MDRSERRGIISDVDRPIFGFTKIEFCPHALQQMALRSITAEQVLQALRKPTETGLPTQMYRFRIRRQISRYKALDVVYQELTDRLRVITAFPKVFPKR